MKKKQHFPDHQRFGIKKLLLVMKLTTIFLFLTGMAFAAKTYSQETRFDLNVKNANIIQVFDEIERITDFGFLFKTDQMDLNKHYSFDLKNADIEKILNKVLDNNLYSYKLINKNIVITRVDFNQSPQQKSVSGKVTDPTGGTLPGVSVVIKGTTTGTITDMDGNFKLSNVPENAILQFSFVGMKSQEVTTAGKTSVNVVMKEVSIGIEEVVAVGYGVQKKANLTGAVDRVTSESLSALKVNTMGEALQGQVANMTVSIADGKPGRSASFNIRGTTSINGGSPLIVIDGVPQSNTEINNLSPQDIEDISILKDAASSAIYGARASYGVILITTKKAKAGDLTIEYNNYFGFSKATYIPDVYDNPVDYYDIMTEFDKNIGQSYLTDAQKAYPAQVAADPSLPHAQVTTIGGKANLLLGGEVHNYYKEWFRTYSPKQNHHISLKGGSEKFQYYLSGDYNREEGALEFKPEEINRYSLRSNVKYNFSKSISIYNNTSLLKRNETQPNQYLYNFCSNIYRFIENTNPLMPEYVDVNGANVPTDIGFYRKFLTNQSDINQEMNEMLTTLGTDISLLKNDLKIHADFTYQFNHTNKLRWWDNTGPYLSHSFNNKNIVLDAYSDAGPSTIYRSLWNTKTSNINAYATYSKTLGKHEMSLMGGFNQESYDYFYVNATHTYPLSGIPQHSLNLATGIYKATDDDDRNASRSTFFRLNYNYDKKYLLEINGCYNLSSKFSEDKRDAMFASISGGWRISEEPFFEPLKSTIGNLKIRGSFGSLGNQNIGSYDYLPIMSVSQSTYLLDGNLVNYTTSPSPKSANFTWETSKTIDAGIDISLLNNRLSTTFDIYQRNTDNMLAPYHSLPGVYGATVPKENIASLRNRGWELSMGWNDNFELKGNKFNYNVRFNLSDYKAEITDYYNPTNYLGDYYVGQEIGEMWGLNTLGFFQTDEEAQKGAKLNTSSYKAYYAAGCLKFEDKNADGTISKGAWTLDNPGDFQIIGNSTPRYQYGLTLNANWKGFDVNAFFKGVGKQDVYPGVESCNFWSAYNRKYQVLLKHVVENRWTPETPNAYFPRPMGYLASSADKELSTNQTRYLQNASYLRLKNLTIGYTIPAKLANKIKAQRLRVWVSGQNLFEITKLDKSLDPEGLTKDPDGYSSNLGLGTSYPIQRVYSFGLEVQF